MNRGRLGPAWFTIGPAGFVIGFGRLRLGVRDRRKSRAYYAERNGFVRVHRLGPYVFRIFTDRLPS